MIYLARYTISSAGVDIAIAAVEDASRADYYLARGYRQCSQAAFSAAWSERDRLVRLVQQAEARPAPKPTPEPGLERAVNATNSWRGFIAKRSGPE